MNANEIAQFAHRISEFLDEPEKKVIPAIRELRSIPGIDLGLKEAKDLIDPRKDYSYYQNMAFFDKYIADRLASRKPKMVTLVTTVSHVEIHIPLTSAVFDFSVAEARTLRDQLIALDLG